MISRKEFYDNGSAVSVLVGTLLLILVVVIATVSIATIYSTLAKDTSNKIGISTSVIDRGMPLYIGGADSMIVLTQSLADSYNKNNPALFITTGSMAQDAVPNALNIKILDVGMMTGTPASDPDLKVTQIGGSCYVGISHGSHPTDIPVVTILSNVSTTQKDADVIAEVASEQNGKLGTVDFGDAALAILNGYPIAVTGTTGTARTTVDYTNISIAAKNKYRGNTTTTPYPPELCYSLNYVTRSNDILSKPFLDYSTSITGRDSFEKTYRVSITDL